MKRVINWLLDKWLAGFITALLFFLLKLYLDLPSDKKAIFFNFSWVGSILNSEIKLWKVLVIICFLVIMFFRKKIKSESPNYNVHTPQKPNYRTDFFGQNNAKWAWDFEFDSDSNKFNVINIAPLCRVCSCSMELDTYSFRSAVCPKCRLEGKRCDFEIKQLLIDVSKEIVRRYNSNEWQKVNI